MFALPWIGQHTRADSLIESMVGEFLRESFSFIRIFLSEIKPGSINKDGRFICSEATGCDHRIPRNNFA